MVEIRSLSLIPNRPRVVRDRHPCMPIGCGKMSCPAASQRSDVELVPAHQLLEVAEGKAFEERCISCNPTSHESKLEFVGRLGCAERPCNHVVSGRWIHGVFSAPQMPRVHEVAVNAMRGVFKSVTGVEMLSVIQLRGVRQRTVGGVCFLEMQ